MIPLTATRSLVSIYADNKDSGIRTEVDVLDRHTNARERILALVLGRSVNL